MRWNGACRWSTASCCWSTRPRAPCRRPASCCARRWPRICRCSGVNKTDRPDARIFEVVSESHDLLLDVATDLDDEAQKAAEDALGLPTLYASGRAGIASTTEPANGENPDGENLDPLFDVLLEHIPPPQGDPEAPLQALVTNLDASAFLGRLALIRIYKGKIRRASRSRGCVRLTAIP